ncbi:MAG: hypothetical protein MJB14_21760 [Spirochaetes bacterium]|nr:hypothetical protein [Spirochaetota bacterium]
MNHEKYLNTELLYNLAKDKLNAELKIIFHLEHRKGKGYYFIERGKLYYDEDVTDEIYTESCETLDYLIDTVKEIHIKYNDKKHFFINYEKLVDWLCDT